MIGEPPDHLVVVATPGVHEPRVRRFGPSPPVRTSEVTPNRRTRWPARPVGVVVGRIAGAHFYHGVSAGIGTRRATTPRGRRRQTRSTSSFGRRRFAVVRRRTPEPARTGLDPSRDCVEVGGEPERRVGDQETLGRSEPGEAVGHRAVEQGDRHPTPLRLMPRRQRHEVADQARTSVSSPVGGQFAGWDRRGHAGSAKLTGLGAAGGRIGGAAGRFGGIGEEC